MCPEVRPTHQPKGSMCISCEHVHRNCTHLDFSKMKVIEKHPKFLVVKCIDFKHRFGQ